MLVDKLRLQWHLGPLLVTRLSWATSGGCHPRDGCRACGTTGGCARTFLEADLALLLCPADAVSDSEVSSGNGMDLAAARGLRLACRAVGEAFLRT